MKRFATVFALVLSLIGVVSLPAHAQGTAFIDLGGISPAGINSSGQVVGSLDIGGGVTHAVIWTNGSIHDLATIQGLNPEMRNSFGYALNDSGMAVGSSGPFPRAWVWTGLYMFILRGLEAAIPANSVGFAFGLNNHGDAVGISDLDDLMPAIWRADGTLELPFLLPVFSPAHFGAAMDINDSGLVVGYRQARSHSGPDFPPGPGAIGFVYLRGTPNQDVLPPAGYNSVFPRKLNASGEVVGELLGTSPSSRAFIWRSGQTTVLPGLGGDNTSAHGINSSGNIVGWSETVHGSPVRHAVLWTRDSRGVYTATDLNDFLPPDPLRTLDSASGINDDGQVVGDYTSGVGRHGYRLGAAGPVRIIEVTPTQGPRRAPDIDGDGTPDLVAERPTLVRVTTSVTGGNDRDTVDIKLSYINSAGQEEGVRPPTTVSLGTLRANPVVKFIFTPSNVPGQGKLVAEVIQGGDKKELAVETKPVRDINLLYMAVDYLDAVPSLDFATMVFNSGDYLMAVYPLAPNHFLNEPAGSRFVPTPASFLPSQRGAEDDALTLWLEGRLLSGFQAERIIGIVPQRWFTYHQLGGFTEGIVFPNVDSAAFVLLNRPLVTAHELGHTYGFPDGYRLRGDGTCCSFDGQPASGFWVQRNQEVPDSIDYMGDSPGAILYPDQAIGRWSTIDDFAALFRQFRTQPNDPEVLLVTGLISQDSTVELGPMYRLANGTVSQPRPGNAAVRLLAANGNVIAEVTFAVHFLAFTDPPITLTAEPFAFAVPFPANTFEIQIVQAGQVRARVLATTKLLFDAVVSIPDAGFVENPPERRNALENKIHALDRQLSERDFEGARNKLRDDIRRDIVDWLRDNYPTETPRQYRKTGILALVDELIQRLGG